MHFLIQCDGVCIISNTKATDPVCNSEYSFNRELLCSSKGLHHVQTGHGLLQQNFSLISDCDDWIVRLKGV